MRRAHAGSPRLCARTRSAWGETAGSSPSGLRLAAGLRHFSAGIRQQEVLPRGSNPEKLTWAELTHPDDLAADLGQFERVLAGQSEGYGLDERFIRQHGQLLHAAISVGCERDTSGTPLRFYATAEDLGARELKLAEDSARRLNRPLRVLSSCNAGLANIHDESAHLLWLASGNA